MNPSKLWRINFFVGRDIFVSAVLLDILRFVLRPLEGLSHLAVHPDYWGKGIGSMLVRRGISEAEEMGLDVFLRAKKAGLGVYKRTGFQLVDQIIQDDS
jgi:GNAT superfamily N-acetyltransferase